MQKGHGPTQFPGEDVLAGVPLASEGPFGHGPLDVVLDRFIRAALRRPEGQQVPVHPIVSGLPQTQLADGALADNTPFCVQILDPGL